MQMPIDFSYTLKNNELLIQLIESLEIQGNKLFEKIENSLL